MGGAAPGPIELAGRAMSDRLDNAPKFTGHGFGDRLELRISNMLHGYGRVDRRDLDLSISEVLNDDIAWQHSADLVIGGQRLMRQRWIAGAENPIVPEIEIELFLHCRSNIDIGQHTKSLGLKRLGDALDDRGEITAYGFSDIVFHLTSMALANGGS